MSTNGHGSLSDLLERHEPELLAAWVREQQAGLGGPGQPREQEVRARCADFLRHLRRAAQAGDLADTEGPHWGEVRDLLAEVSRDRGAQGFSPSQTATFVFSLKKPLFDLLRRDRAGDADA